MEGRQEGQMDRQADVHLPSPSSEFTPVAERKRFHLTCLIPAISRSLKLPSQRNFEKSSRDDVKTPRGGEESEAKAVIFHDIN